MSDTRHDELTEAWQNAIARDDLHDERLQYRQVRRAAAMDEFRQDKKAIAMSIAEGCAVTEQDAARRRGQ
jgi:hypothetical protein